MIWYIITLGNEGFIFILFLFLLQLNGCLHTGFPAFQTFKHFIGVGRFRILGGGQGLVYWGGKGGQIPSRHMTSFRRHVPNRFLINQCQIITFLILKYDIKNSRIELRGIVLPVQVDALLGGGGGGGGGGAEGQRVCWPPLSNYWGGLAPPPPLPTPMHFSQDHSRCAAHLFIYCQCMYMFSCFLFFNIMFTRI